VVVVDTSDATFRTTYANHAAADDEARGMLFRRMRADSISLTTGESFVEPLTLFFRAREARR
jgi:hypothetical protein